MTPRALLTTIGATAIGFAIAIGSVAGFSADGTTTTSATAQQTVVAAQRVQRMTYAAPGTHLAPALAFDISDGTALATRDCAIAL
jgi:hypothetical protein